MSKEQKLQEIEKAKSKRKEAKKIIRDLTEEDPSLLEMLDAMKVKSAENTPNKERILPKMKTQIQETNVIVN